MSPITSFILVLLLASGILVPGIILIKNGKNNKTLLIIGWVMVATLIAAAIFGLVFFIIVSGSSILGWLLFAVPFMIIAGLIVTLAFGIDCLTKGLTKDKEGNINKGKLITGIVLLAIHITVILSLIILVVLFANGLIPIALM